MKKFSLIIIISLLLTSCTNTTPQPTITPMETLTATPSLTPNPTLTQIPTATSIPALPDTIEFIFEESISQTIQEKIKFHVNEAYWYFLSLDCSPDGFKARFYIGDGGNSDYVNGTATIENGVSGKGIDSLTSEYGSISHEVAHAICQHAFTKRANMGSFDLRWLTEAVVNYFQAKERITNAGNHFGITTLDGWDRATAEGLRANFCEISPSMLESSNADKLYPNDYNTVGEVATTLLVKTTPDGLNALLSYYKFLNQDIAAEAFLKAFGRTKEEFYQEYQSECDKGFPAILK